MNTFDGDWVWIDPPFGTRRYGIRILGNVGICTETNAPKYFNVGDVMLNIERASDNLFFGRHIFTDGMWHEVSGRFEGDILYMLGGGWKWKLKRVKDKR